MCERKPIMSAQDLGALIRSRRQALEMSQIGLAKKAGVGRPWLSEVEQDKKEGAPLDLVVAVLDGLGCTLEVKIELTGGFPVGIERRADPSPDGPEAKDPRPANRAVEAACPQDDVGAPKFLAAIDLCAAQMADPVDPNILEMAEPTGLCESLGSGRFPANDLRRANGNGGLESPETVSPRPVGDGVETETEGATSTRRVYEVASFDADLQPDRGRIKDKTYEPHSFVWHRT
jgi:transcriptional regulator with XRE-family HTH domain